MISFLFRELGEGGFLLVGFRTPLGTTFEFTELEEANHEVVSPERLRELKRAGHLIFVYAGGSNVPLPF